jgi:hypothetical protein
MTCALIDRSDDLFALVWRGAAGGGGSMDGHPSCNPLSSRPVAAVVPVPERPAPPPAPPSEAEMESWLVPIVSGGDDVVAGRRAWVDDDQMVPSAKELESSDRKLQVSGDDGREVSFSILLRRFDSCLRRLV